MSIIWCVILCHPLTVSPLAGTYNIPQSDSDRFYAQHLLPSCEPHSRFYSEQWIGVGSGHAISLGGLCCSPPRWACKQHMTGTNKKYPGTSPPQRNMRGPTVLRSWQQRRAGIRTE